MRYFILFYRDVTATTVSEGWAAFTHTRFPNSITIKEKICEGDKTLRNPIITNIIELTEEDFNEWGRGLQQSTYER